MINLDELKWLAETAHFNDGEYQNEPYETFQAAATPTTVLALIARVRELETGVRRAYRRPVEMTDDYRFECGVCEAEWTEEFVLAKYPVGEWHEPDCIVETLPKE